jgi:membrane fusion protein (multidrug efflux system)
MDADVNLGSPTRNPGSDEIHNLGGLLAEGEPMVSRERDGASGRDRVYRVGYRDGFHDASQTTATPDDEDEKQADEPEKPRSALRRILPYAAGALVLLVLIVAGLIYWLNARHYETTDDAFIDAHVANVSSQIAGRVIGISFVDNQRVASGQALIEIDPRDYQEQLDQALAKLGTAQAQLAQAQAQVDLQKANLEQAAAQVGVAEADLRQASQDLARYRGVDPRAVTRQDVDKISATAASAQARLDANRAAVGGARAQIAAAEAQVQAEQATVREAEANVANARLQLSYTKIVAPIDGRVAKRNVEVGTYVSPGQALLAVVPPDMFVTANFKETQLTNMKPGDPVDITVDAWPSINFHGRVNSFQTGTGSAFSTLPAENATGNYVKVVQRLPVKIVFDDSRVKDVRLAPGLSVEPSVKVR